MASPERDPSFLIFSLSFRKQILKGDPKLLFPFLEYIRNKFLSNFQPAEPLEEYQAALLRLANEHKSHLDGTQGRVEFIDPQPSQEALPSGRDHQRPSSANYQYVGKHSRIELTPLALEFAAILAVCSVRTWIAPDLLLDVRASFIELVSSSFNLVTYIRQQHIAGCSKYRNLANQHRMPGGLRF